MNENNENNFENIGSWKNIELTKWFNNENKVSYNLKINYKQNMEWTSKTLTVFPSEVLDLKKAMEIIEKDLFNFGR
ncbi:MAG: hypothetical protein V5A68_06970 [Candidatus Thermoplasmatota archaeon]